MDNLPTRAARNLAEIRNRKPLIHNITNFVVMNYTANALLAIGASPVMSHAVNEVEEMVTLAGALVLNIGTLTDDWVASMVTAGKKATDQGIPVILDPVGSGATALRTAAAQKIISQVGVSLIRGNASEILSLRHAKSRTKGVDSLHGVEDAAQAAGDLAFELATTLAITGPVDLVTDGKRAVRISNGHPLMTRVTGTGCTATATIGAFLAVDPDPLSAGATALAYFGLAGEVAAESCDAPGTFMIKLIDALYTVTPEELERRCRFDEDS